MAFALFSCTRQQADTPVAALPQETSNPYASKVINKPLNAEESTLLLYLEEALPGEELPSRGIVALEPLFTRTPGSEELMARLGMDKWYLATLEEGVPATAVAKKLSSLPAVGKIQFNTRMEGPSKLFSAPCSMEGIPTKAAADAVFDDPMLADQWNYINIGDLSVSSHAKAGASKKM